MDAFIDVTISDSSATPSTVTVSETVGDANKGPVDAGSSDYVGANKGPVR